MGSVSDCLCVRVADYKLCALPSEALFSVFIVIGAGPLASTIKSCFALQAGCRLPN